MNKTTVCLSDSQIEDLEAISKRRGLTLEELIQRAVAAYIADDCPETGLTEMITEGKRKRKLRRMN